MGARACIKLAWNILSHKLLLFRVVVLMLMMGMSKHGTTGTSSALFLGFCFGNMHRSGKRKSFFLIPFMPKPDLRFFLIHTHTHSASEA